MHDITVKRAAEITGGILIGNGENEISSVCIDSRKVTDGALFAALKGERVDGHDYIEKAFQTGAVCCLAERSPENCGGTLIIVPDVAAALRKLAEAYRKLFNIPVIGIAGSVGKTTAKEMVASVLSQRYKVHKTEKNLNNELGVPLTVFGIEPEHEAAVIEMGISDFGEMSRLARMVRPTMAVYTVIGHAHLEQLIDLDGVLKAKTEMLDFMPDDACVFLNADDEKLASVDCRQKRVFYGTGENACVRAENLRSDLMSADCDIVCGSRRIPVHIPAYGKHMVYAALEGSAVGMELGLSDSEIAAGIAAYETIGRRANVIDTGDITLIDDCYNANPDSVKCGIDSLAAYPGRRVCILGDMLGMGENVAALHSDVGEYAGKSGASLILTVGKRSENTHKAASEYVEAHHFDTNAELIAALPNLIKRGDAVLVKASHDMHFDEISDFLSR